MVAYVGRTALVTGASSGIGAAFARALAVRGMNVILVARSAAQLGEIASGLAAKHGVRAEVIVADLAKPEGVATVVAEVERRGLGVDLLVNNAGFGRHGGFETLSAGGDADEIGVNITSLVTLTHAIIPTMLARGQGGIINVASTLAFQPVPYMAVYGATKAFVLSFTQALAEEYRGRGIRCLALCPGTTATGFYAVSGGEAVFGRMHMRTADGVVATGLRALERGRTVVIDGAANRRLFRLTATLPGTVSARLIGTTLHPREG